MKPTAAGAQYRLFDFNSSGSILGSAVKSQKTQAYVSGLKHINNPKRDSTVFFRWIPVERGEETRLFKAQGRRLGPVASITERADVSVGG